jgi:hypothetical protein
VNFCVREGARLTQSVSRMTRKEILFLLLPSAFLVLISGLAFSGANAFSFSPRIEQRRQKDFEKFIASVESGAVELTKEKSVKLLRDSRNVEEAMVAGHASTSRTLGAAILVGVIVQVYVVFRVRAGRVKAKG